MQQFEDKKPKPKPPSSPTSVKQEPVNVTDEESAEDEEQKLKKLRKKQG